MDFQHHPSFVDELDRFIKKHCNKSITAEITLRHIENLLSHHFARPSLVSIPANHLGRAPGFGDYPIYFHRLFIGGCKLKKTQHPKCYFYMPDESLISILCCGSHIENYQDSELRATALERLNDMLEAFKSAVAPPHLLDHPSNADD